MALLPPAALSPHLCPACLLVLDHAAVHQDPPAERGGWHVFLVARGIGPIGKPRHGAVRSVRRLLVGGKARNGAFSAAPAEGRQERQEGGEREREGAEADARATSHANTSRFMPSYQRPATPSCTSASRSAPSSSRSPPSWRSWRPSAGAAENTPIRVFLPTSSRRTLRTAPYLGLPMDSRHGTARSRCFQPPPTSKSSCTALRAKRADRRDRGG